MVKILFVCMGNICRSPTAEAVFRRRIEDAGLKRRIVVDSAGTLDYHAGDPPDRRARNCAGARGYDLAPLRARQVTGLDFIDFDYILAMDRANLDYLTAQCPPAHLPKVRLFMEFARRHSAREVPDPYYGGAKGFEAVLDLIEDAADGLLAHILASLKAQASGSRAGSA